MMIIVYKIVGGVPNSDSLCLCFAANSVCSFFELLNWDPSPKSAVLLKSVSLNYHTTSIAEMGL